MKYETRIVPESGGYIGYAILAEEIVFTSSLQTNITAAAEEVRKYIANNPINVTSVQKRPNSSVQQNSTPNLIPVNRPAPSAQENAPVRGFAPSNSRSSVSPSSTSTRRCCGRG